MTERFERIVIIILAPCVIMLGTWFYYSLHKMERDKIEIDGYQMQIEQLQLESEEQEKRFEESRKRAKWEMQRIQQDTRKILAAKVPKNCDQAMAWGLNEARNFH
jgi:hypothetical protein